MLFFTLMSDTQFLNPKSDENEWLLDTTPLKPKFYCRHIHFNNYQNRMNSLHRLIQSLI